jgi:hypothetical protein
VPLRDSPEMAEEEEVSVRCLPACEEMSLGAEERPLLEDVTKQSSENRDREH